MAKRPSLLNAGREAAAATQNQTPGTPAEPAKQPAASKVTVRPPAKKQRRYAASKTAPTITVAPIEPPPAAPPRASSPAKAAVVPSTATATESSGFGWSFRLDPAVGTSLVTVSPALMGEAGALYREIMSFADARLQRTAKAAEALGRCTSPAEALQTQADYALTSMADYAAESLKLFDMTTALARKGWASLWSVARREGA